MTMSRGLDVEAFVNEQMKAIRAALGSEKALIATSGGVDSTTCAVLAFKAVGKNLVCAFIDDGFRRMGEPDSVIRLLSSLGLPARLVDAREEFTKRMCRLGDAEEKRKVYRETFYETLARVAREEGCKFLVQGTIAADWVETRGGIKTQHNVLEQIGIDSTKRYGFRLIEPLAYLYKDRVREVARHLRVPVAEEQPFPGPGLVVRIVGEIYPEKLEVLREATAIVEDELAKKGPDQYFAAILEDEVVGSPANGPIRNSVCAFFGVPEESIGIVTLNALATGVRKGKRAYGKIAVIAFENQFAPSIPELVGAQKKLLDHNVDYTRILIEIGRDEGEYVVALRAIKTRDFLTAEVVPLDWKTLSLISERILEECRDVSRVCYDVTPKPPATIEFE